MRKYSRNEPCWCDSGKKYKKCHYNRQQQEKESPWAAVESLKKSFRQKKCYADGIGAGSCDGGIIKAHTISKGANLSKITKNGKVYHYNADISYMQKSNGKLSVKLIGARDASVFFGFCAKHDRELFSCLENEKFAYRADQMHAIAYRTLSRELYTKEAARPLTETMRFADKGKNLIEQILIQSALNDISLGNDLARKEIAQTHNLIQEAYISKKNNVIKSLILEFDEILPFVTAGAWSPFTDIKQKSIQNGFLNELLEQIIVSTFSSDNSSFICLSWRDISNAPGKIIADQILGLSKEQQATVCFQIIAKHVENIFYDPSWFEALDARERKKIDELAASGVDALGSIPLGEIDLNMDFGLPSPIKTHNV